MYINKPIRHYLLVALMFTLLYPLTGKSQTDLDAVMMAKKSFCVGPMYGYSSWKNYWEGTYKRDNENLGTVSAQMFSVMGTYGITNKLNVLFNVPYIKTKATAGTLRGMEGFQDISLWLKWEALRKKWGNQKFSLLGLGGISFPASNYTPDFLPMSIGLHSTNLSARLMADYHLGKFFVTGSGTYTYRSNIHIDRNSYYTTEMHLTDEVEMSDVVFFNFRTGYMTSRFVAEAVISNMTTLGGFDIRKNDMPFPSNKMNATTAGASFRYEFKKPRGISVMGDANYTVAGRNMGQATSFGVGIFYLFSVGKQSKKN